MTMALLPELVLSTWALVLTLIAGWRHSTPEEQRQAGFIALVGLIATLFAELYMWAADVHPAGLPVMVALDGFRYASSAVLLLGAILSVMLSLGYVGRERIWAPEYYILILLGTVGAMFMTSGAD